jgi:hypothetical protein
VEEGGEGGQGNSPHPVDCPQEHLGVSHLFDIIGWCFSSCNAEHPQTVPTEDGEDNIVLSENGARGGGDGGASKKIHTSEQRSYLFVGFSVARPNFCACEPPIFEPESFPINSINLP